MKVIFDHQAYVIQEYGGVSRYFYEVSKSLRDDFNVDVINTTCLSNNIYAANGGGFATSKFFPHYNFKGKKRILEFINERNSRAMLNENYDVFHPTYYASYFYNNIGNKPFVVTIHDLIHEKFKGVFKEFIDDDHLFAMKKGLLEKSSKIIAVSNNTKEDIIDFYKIPEAKIDVIYLGNSIHSDDENAALRYSNYVLYVGGRNLYKNFLVFIETIVPILLKEKDVKIICAGSGKFTKTELSLFDRLNISAQIIHLDINDKTLSALYKNALFFVFPSLYEGFGIPILEAFNCGCPVLLSNTSSLPEIGNDAAIYFDPYDKDDLLGKFELLLRDVELRNELRSAGLKRAAEFSWKETGRRHYDVYKSVI